MTRSDVTEVQEPVDGVPDLPERTDLPDREGESAETDSTAGSPAGQPPRRRFRYTLPGAWVAVAFVCLSFTPSLVPRPGRISRCGLRASAPRSATAWASWAPGCGGNSPTDRPAPPGAVRGGCS